MAPVGRAHGPLCRPSAGLRIGFNYKHTGGAVSWCNLTSGVAPLYARAATSPNQIAASVEDSGVTHLYLSTTGEGVLVLLDDSGDCAP